MSRWSVAAILALLGAAALGACGDDSAGDTPGPIVPEGGPGDGDAPGDGGGDVVMRAEFGLDTRPANPTCKVPARPPSDAPVAFQQVFAATNLYFVVAMEQPPGDSSRWFAVTLDGKILSFPTVNPPAAPTVVADLGAVAGLPVNQTGEGGLFDIAIHPKFAQNGQIFVSWTTTGGPAGFRSVVSRLTTTDNGATFGQHTIILGPFDQPTPDHKGGTAKFGPDGFLYLTFGDGADADKTNGQRADSFFAKVLRIDVDNPSGGNAYGIPAGNPFKNGGGEPATFARGFRNPFRCSFDRGTGELWCGDAGEVTREEIDLVKVGGNYGWPCREGTLPFLPDRCTAADTLTEPIFDFDHGPNPAVIVGGVVYRGAAIPELQGSYLYSNYSQSDAFALSFDPTTGATKSTLLNPVDPRASFVFYAQDNDNEVYPIDPQGHIYKIVRAQPAVPSSFPDRLSKTGCVEPSDPKKPAEGVIGYDVNSPLWSDGADKERYLALPDGKTITVGADGDFDLPIGSVLMKTFSVGGKRIETRLFMRHDDGAWSGYTYEWNDAQTDAVLLPSGKTKKVGAQTWTFPSRGQCASCHTEAAGRTLGLELGQLNGDFTYAKTNRVANQLKTLDHIGMLSAPLGKPVASIVTYPHPTSTGPIDARARSYLHSNCSHCHRPMGPARGELDLRFGTTFAATKTCGTTPVAGTLGVANAKVISPGSPSTSVLSLRPHALGATRMPPLASTVVDTAGVTLLDDWIKSLAACP